MCADAGAGDDASPVHVFWWWWWWWWWGRAIRWSRGEHAHVPLLMLTVRVSPGLAVLMNRH